MVWSGFEKGVFAAECRDGVEAGVYFWRRRKIGGLSVSSRLICIILNLAEVDYTRGETW